MSFWESGDLLQLIVPASFFEKPISSDSGNYNAHGGHLAKFWGTRLIYQLSNYKI